MTDTEYRDQLLANFRALDRKTADDQATIWFDVIQGQDRRIVDLSNMLDQAYLENAHLLARLAEIDREHKARIADLEQQLASARSLVREWQSWTDQDDPNDQPDLDGLLAILDGRDDTAGEVGS